MSDFMYSYETTLGDYLQDIQIADVSAAFNEDGWKLADTYYSGSVFKGLYRSSCEDLYCIESFMLARGYWMETNNHKTVDISGSFDSEGWVNCGTNYYLTGLYRSSPSSSFSGIGYIETLKCSKIVGSIST